MDWDGVFELLAIAATYYQTSL